MRLVKLPAEDDLWVNPDAVKALRVWNTQPRPPKTAVEMSDVHRVIANGSPTTVAKILNDAGLEYVEHNNHE